MSQSLHRTQSLRSQLRRETRTSSHTGTPTGCIHMNCTLTRSSALHSHFIADVSHRMFLNNACHKSSSRSIKCLCSYALQGHRPVFQHKVPRRLILQLVCHVVHVKQSLMLYVSPVCTHIRSFSDFILYCLLLVFSVLLSLRVDQVITWSYG